MKNKIFKKKLQVFISSTFLDLKEERQAAVEAILGFNHIPAGMELFKAGNDSQLNTIKKWIDNSDVYLLILGGRYGSIENESKKSYTHLEYEYAINKGIPVFSIILSDSFLEAKNKNEDNVFEKDNIKKYKDFKDFVKTKMVKEVGEIKDIKIAIYESLNELEEENEFVGWIPGDTYIESKVNPYIGLKQSDNNIISVKKEIKELKEQLSRLQIYKTCNKLSIPITFLYVYSNSILFDIKSSRHIEFDGVELSKTISFFLQENDIFCPKFLKNVKRYIVNEIKNSNKDAVYIKIKKAI